MRQHLRALDGVAVAALLLGATLAACGGGGGGAQPSPSSAAATLQLSACHIDGAPGARCGTLRVAEDPAHPQGRQIPLHVIVLPAQSPTRLADPLLYFTGYGGAGQDDASWALSTFYRLNQTRDIVLFDQRGSGQSNRMACPGMLALGRSVLDNAHIDSLVQQCLSQTAAVGDPRFYTTPLAVEDIDRIRAALAYDKVNIYGASYGVSSGLAYLQRHGEHVRTALFDSGSLLDTRLWELAGRSAQQAFDDVLARCAADKACHAAYPNITAEATALFARLHANPVTIAVPDASGAAQQVRVDDTMLAGGLGSLLATTADAAQLPKAVHAAYRGDWPALARQLAAITSSSDDPRFTLVSSWSIACSDEWARAEPQKVAAIGGASPFTAQAVAQAQMRERVCAQWPKATGASGAVHSTVPVVFLNGSADPADPPQNVSGARETMPNSLSVTVPGYGHGVLSQDGSGLLAMQAQNFLQAGKPSRAADWSAAASPYRPPFAIEPMP